MLTKYKKVIAYFMVIAVCVFQLDVRLMAQGIVDWPPDLDDNHPQGDEPGLPNCANAANKFLPCTDPHKWASTGAGNGICGNCGPSIDFTYSGGLCLGAGGGTGGEAGPNCKQCKTPQIIRLVYNTQPVNTATMLLCNAAALAALRNLPAFARCAPVCAFAETPPGLIACIACLGLIIATPGGILCLYRECMETCNYVGAATVKDPMGQPIMTDMCQ